MIFGPQYNEHKLLTSFFKEKRNGYLVEVGAADGIDNSHTNFLINEWQWQGILIEPEPIQFKALQENYKNQNQIVLINKAIYCRNDQVEFIVAGQISRIKETIGDKRKIKKFIEKYAGNVIKVECVILSQVLDDLNAPCNIDFLTIDAEGAELAIINSMDWNRYSFSLVCLEHSLPKDQLTNTMKKYNYVLWEQNQGNSFYVLNTNSNILIMGST